MLGFLKTIAVSIVVGLILASVFMPMVHVLYNTLPK